MHARACVLTWATAAHLSPCRGCRLPAPSCRLLTAPGPAAFAERPAWGLPPPPQSTRRRGGAGAPAGCCGRPVSSLPLLAAAALAARPTVTAAPPAKRCAERRSGLRGPPQRLPQEPLPAEPLDLPPLPPPFCSLVRCCWRGVLRGRGGGADSQVLLPSSFSAVTSGLLVYFRERPTRRQLTTPAVSQNSSRKS